MKLSWKMLPLTFLTLPSLSWGVCSGCVGTWENATATPHWAVNSNWSLTSDCGGNYPGSNILGSGDTATLAGPYATPIALDNGGGTDIIAILCSLNFENSYFINRGSGGGGLLAMNPDPAFNTFNILGGDSIINAQVFFATGPLDVIIGSGSNGGSLTFTNTVNGGEGGRDVIISQSNPNAFLTVTTKADVFRVERDLVITGNAQFVNMNAALYPQTLTVIDEDLVLGASDPGRIAFSNINNSNNPTEIAAFTDIDGHLVLETFGNKQAQLKLENNGNSSTSVPCSQLTATGISGSGNLILTNNGGLTNSAIGVAFLAGPLVGTEPKTWNWIATNNGALSDSGTLGVFAVVPGTFFLNNGAMLLQNKASVTNGAMGVSLTTDAFTQTGGTFTLASSTGPVDRNSLGARLFVNGPMIISGGLFNNSDHVFLESHVALSGSGVVTGTGTFAGTLSSFPTLTPFNEFTNSGLLIPGTPLGILRLVCNQYIQTPEGTLQINILHGSPAGPTSYSQLAIIGNASLDGTLQIVLDPEAKVCFDDEFTILTASNGVTGTFSNVEAPCQFIPELTYLPTSVLLSLTPVCCPPLLCDYIGNFTQTLFASITDTNNFFIKRQLQRVQERISTSAKREKQPSSTEKQTVGNFYIGPIGSVGKSDAEGSQVGFNYWSAGAVAGADYAFSQGGVGALVLYENIKSDDASCDWGNFRTQRAHGSLYGTFVPTNLPKFALDLMMGGGYDWYQIHRNTGRCTASGSPNGYEFDTMLSLEYNVSCKDCKDTHFIPMANLQYAYLKVDDYRENNGLQFDSQKARSLSTVLGIWADHTWQWKNPLTAQVNVGWQHEFKNHNRTLNVCNQCLTLEGARRNNLLTSLDLLLHFQERWSLEASYDLIWNSQFRRNGFYLGLNAAF